MSMGYANFVKLDDNFTWYRFLQFTTLRKCEKIKQQKSISLSNFVLEYIYCQQQMAKNSQKRCLFLQKMYLRRICVDKMSLFAYESPQSSILLLQKRISDSNFNFQSYNTLNKLRKSSSKSAMLSQHTSQRDCFSNYTKSWSNLHHQQLIHVGLREFCFRKSLFNPSNEVVQSYAARQNTARADVPFVDVIYSSKRWLLLQCPKFSSSFFRRLNQGQFGNPYQQLFKIFKSFVSLTEIYGYFKITANMIFMEGAEIKVWISEDVFQNSPMIALGHGRIGEKEFINAFLAMVYNQFRDWQKTGNISTIDEVIKIFDTRTKLNRGSMTVFGRPSDSKASFQANELGYYNQQLKLCRSVQELQNTYPRNSYFHSELSNSFTVKQEQRKQVPKIPSGPKIYGLFQSKQLKSSVYDYKPNESTQVRRTKKKFNLTSTSSTLQKFSEKWRSTVGKKGNKPNKQAGEEIQGDKPNYPLVKIYPPSSEPMSIQNELEDLFGHDNELKLGEEGDWEELEKIAQEIEQVLIW